MTFDEWKHRNASAMSAGVVDAAELAWNAAIEEAAKSCTEIGGLGFSPDEVGEEIRKLKTT